MNAIAVTDTAPACVQRLNDWVAEVARLTCPDAIHWCDGSHAENAALIAKMQADGTLIKLNENTHPDEDSFFGAGSTGGAVGGVCPTCGVGTGAGAGPAGGGGGGATGTGSSANAIPPRSSAAARGRRRGRDRSIPGF